jgi:hypothetical protein
LFVFLSYDVWLALWFTNAATGQVEFGIGLGTLILAANVVLLTSYRWAAIRFSTVGGHKDEGDEVALGDTCYMFERAQQQTPALCLLQPVLGDL